MMKPDLMMFLAVAVVAMVTVAVAQDCETQPGRAQCRAWLPAWFFSTETGKCELRPCHNGRSNRYETEEICQEKCGGVLTEEEDEEVDEDSEEDEQDICQLPAIVGPCRARHRRYFYDAAIGQCRRFFYGGCAGNANNFFKKSDCRSQCQGSTTEMEEESTGEIDQN